jgi:hypothetical protein
MKAMPIDTCKSFCEIFHASPRAFCRLSATVSIGRLITSD